MLRLTSSFRYDSDLNLVELRAAAALALSSSWRFLSLSLTSSAAQESALSEGGMVQARSKVEVLVCPEEYFE